MSNTGSGLTDYPVIIITLFVGATVLVLVYISNLLKSSKEEENVKSTEAPKKEKSKNGSGGNVKSSKKKQPEKLNREQKQFNHPWLVTTLKGHTGQIMDMDFSSNGKLLGSCAEDRTVYIWSTKDWNAKDHKPVRINVEFDHARFIKWSPDSKAILLYKATEQVVDVYKLAKKPEGSISGATKSFSFPKLHTDEMIGLDIACNGKFVMSCSEKNELLIRGLKGDELAKVETYLVKTECARISPCARYVAASGFTPDVKIWEVKYTKPGEFQQLSRAYELTGHTSGIYDISFNTDSSRIATVSKDGTWRAYNIEIDYHKGEYPQLLSSGKYNHVGPAHIVMSPDGEVVTVSSGSSLAFYYVHSGKCDTVLDNIYSGDISRILFDSLGKYVLTAGEKHIRIFHNIPGYRATIASIQSKLKQSLSSAQKERITLQMKEAESFLKNLSKSH